MNDPLNTPLDTTVPNENIEKEVVTILSCDGGGIRGLIPALIGAHLDKQLDHPFASYFDVIAGTSTGGILSLAWSAIDLKTGKHHFTMEQVVDIYRKGGKEIFSTSFSHELIEGDGFFGPKYSSEGIERLTEAYFGDMTLENACTNVLCTSYDLNHHEPLYFRSNWAKHQPNQYNYYMRDVAQATGAAPTYFPAKKVMNGMNESTYCVDGGIIRNNPTETALSFARQLFPNAKKFHILSLGTGKYDPENASTDLDKAGKLKWATQIATYCMDGSSEATHLEVESYMNTQHPINGSTYHRLQPLLSQENMAMDDSSALHLENMEKATMKYLERHSKEIHEIVEILKQSFPH